jgi:ferredoxin--NADP+ reductase
MFRILSAEFIGPDIKRFRIEAPRVAAKRKPGQFVIVRVATYGERIPLTIAAADPDEGWIELIVQGIGATTHRMNRREAGDAVADIAGPLGRPSAVDHYGTAVCIGGGVGTAIAYPTAVAMRDAGNDVISIIGGRTVDHVILADELAEVGEVVVTTDDGSAGRHGFVTDALQDLIDQGTPIDIVFAIGPIPMMQAVAETTRPHDISTVVSLNPIMVDGTGMCGGCRVSVGGKTRFACVDGPDFNAHEVDFEVLARRNRSYLAFERRRMLEDGPDCPVKVRSAAG